MAWLSYDSLVLPKTSKTFRQLIRYGIVGAVSNLAGYLIYLLITWFGVDPKITVTMLYPVGAIMGYFGHSKYSFSSQGGHFVGFMKYTFAHLLGYLLNVSILFFFVDKLLFPHQAVQLVAIFVVAGFLFTIFKFFVFPPKLLGTKKYD